MKITRALLLPLLLLALVGCDESSPTEPIPEGGFRFQVEGLEVRFETTVTVNPGATVDWDFGDGSGAAGYTATHVYGAAGSYSVTQEIRGDGPTQRTIQTVSVERAPVCRFELIETESDFCIQTVNRSDHWDSSRPGHTASWDFGDGNDSVDDEPLHCYAQAGDYQVFLTVANNGGSDECGKLLRVSDAGQVDAVVQDLR